jgi:hypothetical protein
VHNRQVDRPSCSGRDRVHASRCTLLRRRPFSQSGPARSHFRMGIDPEQAVSTPIPTTDRSAGRPARAAHHRQPIRASRKARHSSGKATRPHLDSGCYSELETGPHLARRMDFCGADGVCTTIPEPRAHGLSLSELFASNPILVSVGIGHQYGLTRFHESLTGYSLVNVMLRRETPVLQCRRNSRPRAARVRMESRAAASAAAERLLTHPA